MTKSMDKLLRDALRARAGGPPAAPCLDALTIAAMADGTLPARERSKAEAHVADCARCQAVLAALARTMPPAVPVVWWRRPAFVWLAPLTAAAAALLVWTAVPRREIAAPAAQFQRANTPAVEPGAARSASPLESPDLRSQREAAPSAPPSLPVPSEPQLRDRITDNQRAPGAAQKALAESAVAPLATPAPTADAEARIAGAQLPSTPLPPAAAPAPPPSASPSVEQDASRTAPAEQTPQRARAGTMAVTSNSAGQALMRRFAPEPTIVSPNPAIRWRIADDGVVYHSADSGATWQAQPTGVNVRLAAGSSPSRSVCWLVGAAGLVLMTGDEGRSWQRLTFPISIDLSSVRATDDKTATVVAADGRAFTTSDGGRTWRP
jgi:hypothetical protein